MRSSALSCASHPPPAIEFDLPARSQCASRTATGDPLSHAGDLLAKQEGGLFAKGGRGLKRAPTRRLSITGAVNMEQRVCQQLLEIAPYRRTEENVTELATAHEHLRFFASQVTYGFKFTRYL